MPHFSAACQVLHGWASIEMGAGASSLGVAAQALAELDAGPTSIGVPTYRTFFGAALLRLGDPACLHELRRARHDAEASGDRWWLAETLRLLASAEQAVGDPAATSDLLAGALALAARQGAALLEARITADVAAARSAMTP